MGFRNWITNLFNTEQKSTQPATLEPPPHDVPFVVPGRGDVFSFYVTVRLKWRCETTSESELQRHADALRDGALNKVGRIVWDQARSLSPFEPARAESVINNSEPVRNGICYRVRNHMVRCSPSVQVLIDPELKKVLAEFATNRVRIEEGYRLNLIQDEQACKRAEAWLNAIQRLEQFPHLGKDERQFLLPYAARLADKDFAEVVGQMAQDRHIKYVELAEVLGRTSREHERVGLFEFASAYDKALQTFCRQVGVSPASFLLPDFGEPKEPEERGAR